MGKSTKFETIVDRIDLVEVKFKLIKKGLEILFLKKLKPCNRIYILGKNRIRKKYIFKYLCFKW